MEHDTTTLSRQATLLAPPKPVVVTQPAGASVAAAAETPGDRKLSDVAGAPPDSAQPPELKLLGDRIAELSARIDAANHELLCQLREFDGRYGWEGFRSCAHWLNWRTGLDLGAAREKLRVATALADLNHVSAAMARGRLSYSKARALTRVATPATEARLLAVALRSTAAQVERLVRAWRRADRDADPDAERERLASRALSMQVDQDGMVVMRGRLTPEVGAVLMRAVEAALEQVPEGAAGGESTISQRRADALGLIGESALEGGLDPGNSADRFQVNVHVQADTLVSRLCAADVAHVSAATRKCKSAALETGVSSATPAERDAAAVPAAPAADLVAAYPTTEQAGSVRDVTDHANRRGDAAGWSPLADASPQSAQSAQSPDDLDIHEGRCPGIAGRPSTPSPATVATPAVSAEPFLFDIAFGEPTVPAADLDAGQAVIEQAGGLHLGTEAARRVACDAGLVVQLHADGEVLDVGRRTRTIPSALRRALLSRDRSQCQFPGCDSRRCDAHHVVHWADGGETRLTNLVNVCRFHHRAVHEEGFRVVPGETEGQFRFLRPDGTPVSAEPPPASWTGAPLAPIDARLAAAGISIGPHTATPEWYGESLDLTAALDVLWEPPAAVAHAGH